MESLEAVIRGERYIVRHSYFPIHIISHLLFFNRNETITLSTCLFINVYDSNVYQSLSIICINRDIELLRYPDYYVVVLLQLGNGVFERRYPVGIDGDLGVDMCYGHRSPRSESQSARGYRRSDPYRGVSFSYIHGIRNKLRWI